MGDTVTVCSMLSYLTYGEKKEQYIIRKAIVKHMLTPRMEDLLKPHMEPGKTVSQYIEESRMSKGGT